MKLELSDFFSEIYELDKEGIPQFKVCSGGKWYFPGNGKFLDVRSPIDNSVIARISVAEESHAEKILADAADARPTIRRLPAIDRMNIMVKASSMLQEQFESMRDAIVINNGKTLADAGGEIKATMHRLTLVFEEASKIFGEYLPGDWAEENIGKYALVIREPVGVVLAIAPFNYPLFITYTKAIPALLAGNSVIIKPPSSDPLPALLMAEILIKAGLPPAAISIITGHGSIGSYMAKHSTVDMLTFTGSTEIGEKLSEISGIKKIHLELGGKGVAIVLDDADLEGAASMVLSGSLKNAGQRCDAISRVLVQRGASSRFQELLVQGIKSWTVGDPRKEESKIGPLIDSDAVKRVMRLIDDAVKKGAKLVHGGKSNGNFVEPTLLLDVPLDADVMWEETFGPVVPVATFNTVEEAIEISNKSEYGLDSAVFTKSLHSAWKVSKRLEVGEVTVNNFPAHGVGFFPFGGVKESGLGREGIGYSIDEFTNMKTIVFDTSPANIWKAVDDEMPITSGKRKR